jgi:phosphoribosylformimino-5-aminoimidazole carboxamide ribotide isomerase
MSEFIVYPAIDLRFGKVVRLRQGKGDQQTVFGNNPKAVANDWIEQGAEWLHVVNLNGAFGEGTEENQTAIEEIIEAGKGKVKIQLGGGIRSVAEIEAALDLGVNRIVLGTSVIENPVYGKNVLKRFGGDKVAFGFDVLGQELMSRGWQSPSGISMIPLGEELALAGARTLIYTNIKKDGMQSGVDWKNARQLADHTGLSVIASGGTAALEDIAHVRTAGLAGVIVGRALYEGNFSLQEAINVR